MKKTPGAAASGISPAAVAATILAGFDRHYRLFRRVSASAGVWFRRGAWVKLAAANVARIELYDRRVAEAVDAVGARFPRALAEESLWPRVKTAYVALLHERDHQQPELAETFFNSVACRLLHRSYFNNEFIFFRPAVSTDYIEGRQPVYRCYYPPPGRLRSTLRRALVDLGLGLAFENLERDLDWLLEALRPFYPTRSQRQANCQLQLLAAPFYRDRAAYLVGRLINGSREQPLVIPLLQNAAGSVALDALLYAEEDLATLFSFSRAYLMVDMAVPSAYVDFLQALLPAKPRAEIYTLLGLQKHGKTLFYRELQHHLRHSEDRFTIAPGVRGMVMLVFTLPSFPYVFKIIKDRFGSPKDLNRAAVMAKYQLVKRHDRVGRLADTLEYSDVAFPLGRVEPALLNELRQRCARNIEFDGDRLVIKHLYIERRMTPLNIYLRNASGGRQRAAIRDYGNAIAELAAANIFPGDMLLKNFGVTRHGRVVFYDYDEICYLTECRFRSTPPPASPLEDMLGDVYYSVGENDVFPDQFARYAFPVERDRRFFLLYHPRLSEAEFWQTLQRRILEHGQQHGFPYDEKLRFCQRFGGVPE